MSSVSEEKSSKEVKLDERGHRVEGLGQEGGLAEVEGAAETRDDLIERDKNLNLDAQAECDEQQPLASPVSGVYEV